jgi:FtsH-binding integral membrane protein
MKNRTLSIDAVPSAEPSVRVQFIHNTYLHLAGAILSFIVVEYLLFNSSLKPYLVSLMLASSYSWLIVLGVFMGVGYFADK